VKIYSNKEFSQLPEFLRNEQVVPDGFKSLYESSEHIETKSKGVEPNKQDKEKEEQLTILEDLRAQGTREL